LVAITTNLPFGRIAVTNAVVGLAKNEFKYVTLVLSKRHIALLPAEIAIKPNISIVME
jgi:hypothetical protein